MKSILCSIIFYRKHLNSSAETSEESVCDHKTTVIISFGVRDIQRGRCISIEIYYLYEIKYFIYHLNSKLNSK